MTTDWVRVRDERTGHHITVTRRRAASKKHYRTLDGAPAVDVNGQPLAPTPAPKPGPKTAPKEAK